MPPMWFLTKGRQIYSTKRYCLKKEYRDACEKWGNDKFRVGMGAESIQELVKPLTLRRSPLN